MAAFTVDRDDEVIASGLDGSRLGHECSVRVAVGVHMDRVRFIDRLACGFEQAFFDHDFGAASGFFGRLEHAHNIGGEFFAALRKVQQGTHEARGVHVVAARVHFPDFGRRIFEPGFFRDR